jgi:hypothetical protein
MADSTLAAIRKKVRRLTRSPSEQQLSTTDIDEYVNTFILYDFPQELRLYTLRQIFTFYTSPNVDAYETNSISGDPLENFENKYTAVYSPIYVAGYEARLVQDVTEFTSLYPLTNAISTETTGDGVTVNYSGTLSAIPVVPDQVVFNGVDANNNGMQLHDDGSGVLSGDGSGTINYVTGAYTLIWTTAPAASTNINSLTIPYTAARPDTILYYDNKFTVRPVPDQVYPIQVEVDVRPTELLAAGSSPDLEQWWSYIAYGATRYVFQDRTDNDSIADIMPELKRQELLVLRRTLAQISKERAPTIYTNGTFIGYGGRWRSGSNY